MKKSLNINFLSETKTDNTSRAFKYMLIFFYVIFSVDFGYNQYRSRKMKLFIYSLSLLQCAAIATYCSTMFLLTVPLTYALWYSSFTIQYIAYVLILMFSNKDRSYYNLERHLILIDSEIGVNHTYNMNAKRAVVYVVAIFFRITQTVYYYLHISEFEVHKVLIPFFIPILSIDTVLLMYFFVFYSVYCRVRELSSHMDRSKASVLSCHYVYKTIVDIADQVKSSFDPVLIVAMLFNTMDAMLTIYSTLLLDAYQQKLSTYAASYVAITQALSLMFAPALAAGVLSSEADKLRLKLHDRLLEDRDLPHARDIKRFISYVETRSFKYFVCKIIPLNWSMPVMVLNVCITYLIVIIQLTHLY